AARYGAWQRVGGLPLGCGADVVVAACEAETPGSDRPSNRYSSGVLVPRLLAHLPHFLVVVFAVVVLYVRVSKDPLAPVSNFPCQAAPACFAMLVLWASHAASVRSWLAVLLGIDKRAKLDDVRDRIEVEGVSLATKPEC